MSDRHVKYLLIGGGLASSAAAAAIREADPTGDVLLVGQEVTRPYYRPELSKSFLVARRAQAELFTHEANWFDEHEIELRTGQRAARVDPARCAVALDNGQEVAFDRLLIATGASPRRLTISGSDLPNVFHLRTLANANRLRNAMETAKAEGRRHEAGRGRAVVVGGGVLGVELAASLRACGLGVDLLVAYAHPWKKFAGEVSGRFASRLLESRGVRVHAPASAARLEGDGRVQRVILTSGAALECDLVVVAIGAVPNKDLIRGTSIASEKAILVNGHCRTSHAEIFAAGDCAAIFDPLFGKYRHLEHWESAVAMGRIAGHNMAGRHETWHEVSHFATNVFDVPVSVWGSASPVERRIFRGNTASERGSFVEFGIAADSRIAQIVAVGSYAEEALLAELIRRRHTIEGHEDRLRDPAIAVNELLKN